MKIEFIFNPKYEMSTGHYQKIGGKITMDDGKTHVFCVIKNIGSGAIERQKYADCGSWKANKVMSGMDRSMMYVGACKPEDKDTFLPLAYHLKFAFGKLDGVVGFDPADKNAVLSAIDNLIADMRIPGETPAPVPAPEVPEEFTDIPASELEGKDDFINRLLSEIHGEIGKIIEIEGVKYRLNKEGESMSLQWNKGGGSVHAEEGEGVRHFVQMAKIVNAEGLSGIVNGNFYPIIGEREFNGKNFLVLNVDGEEKALASSRVTKVNVYSDALA